MADVGRPSEWDQVVEGVVKVAQGLRDVAAEYQHSSRMADTKSEINRALKDPKTAADAPVLLKLLFADEVPSFKEDQTRLREAFSLLRDPARSDVAKQVVKLASGGEEERVAARQLLDLGMSKDPARVLEASHLATLLLVPDQQPGVVRMLSSLDAEQRTELLKLLDPAHGDAGKILRRSLLFDQSSTESDAAKEFLMLRIGRFSTDGPRSENLLKILKNEKTRDSFVSIISCTDDPIVQQQIVALVLDPKTQSAAAQLVECALMSSDRAMRRAGFELLADLRTATLTAKADPDAETLLRQFGGNEWQREIATVALGKLPKYDRRQLIELAEKPENKAAVDEMLAKLGSDKTADMNAVRALLGMRNGSHREEADRLTVMLGCSATRDHALKVLSNLDGDAIQRLFLISAQPSTNEAANKLMGMLPAEKQAVNALLRHFFATEGTGRGRQRESLSEANTKLLEMFLSPDKEQAAIVRKTLEVVPIESHRKHMFRMLFSPDTEETARQLLKLAEQHPAAGMAMVRLATQGANPVDMLRIVEGRDGTPGASRLGLEFMKNPVGGAADVLAKITGTDAQQQKIAEKILEWYYSRDKATQESLEDWRMIDGLDSEQQAVLYKLRTDSALCAGAEALTTMLKSESEDQRRTAGQLLTMFSTGGTHFVAAQAFLTALANPQQRDAALCVLKVASEVRVGLEAEDQFARARLLESLARAVFLPGTGTASVRDIAAALQAISPERRTTLLSAVIDGKEDGMLLVHGLSQNGYERKSAQRLMGLITNPSQVREVGKLFSDPKSKEVKNLFVELLKSPDEKTAAGAARLLQLPKEQRRLIAEQPDVAKTVLSCIDDSRLCDRMFRMINDKTNPNLCKELLTIMGSGDSAKLAIVKSILAALDDREFDGIDDKDNKGKEQKTFEKMFENPQEFQLAKSILHLAKTQQELQGLVTLAADRSQEPQLKRLLKMLEHDTENYARTILSSGASSAQIDAFLHVLDAPNKSAAQYLKACLAREVDLDDEAQIARRRGALNLLAMASSTDAETRATGLMALQELNRATSQRESLLRVANLGGIDKTPACMVRATLDKTNEKSWVAMNSMLRDEDLRSLRRLARLLSSPEPELKKQGQSIFNMIMTGHGYRAQELLLAPQ
jgi:hypothetical protein